MLPNFPTRVLHAKTDNPNDYECTMLMDGKHFKYVYFSSSFNYLHITDV